jgi:NhaA family Na+:H+ antiporter
MASGGEEAGGGPLGRIEHVLRPWVAYMVVPVFALANAGVALGVASLEGLLQPVGLGVVLGLVIGKQAGILGFAWLAVRSGVAQLPVGVTWRHLQGAAALAGIGFTMALFIGSLAFPEPTMFEQAKVAILGGSFVSALVARALFVRAYAAAEESRPAPVPDQSRREPPTEHPWDEAAAREALDPWDDEGDAEAA